MQSSSTSRSRFAALQNIYFGRSGLHNWKNTGKGSIRCELMFDCLLKGISALKVEGLSSFTFPVQGAAQQGNRLLSIFPAGTLIASLGPACHHLCEEWRIPQLIRAVMAMLGLPDELRLD